MCSASSGRWSLVASGEANVGPLVLMLLWLQRERPRLRAAG
jgi:ADP-ribose pyrophosphatase